MSPIEKNVPMPTKQPIDGKNPVRGLAENMMQRQLSKHANNIRKSVKDYKKEDERKS